jgi:HlyD family secretion protein
VPDYLRQDMTVTVNIETDKSENSLAIPNDALFNQQGDTANVLRVKDHKIDRISVTLGLRGLVMTEVTSGLQPGDWVVASVTNQSSPTSSLTKGARVRIKSLDLPIVHVQKMNDSDQTNSKATPVKFN